MNENRFLNYNEINENIVIAYESKIKKKKITAAVKVVLNSEISYSHVWILSV